MNKSENLEILMELIRLGNSVTESDNRGSIPLHVALAYGKPLSIVQTILWHGVNVNQRNLLGMTPMFCACDNEFDNLDIIEEVLRHNASLLVTDNNGRTPLHFAVRNKTSLKVIEKLLEYGADLNAKDKGGNTPFSEFVTYYYSWIDHYNNLLFDYGASIHEFWPVYSV